MPPEPTRLQHLRAFTARHPVAAGALILAALYLWAYLSHRILPGQSEQFPRGWWGWFDQGQTLVSARAFAFGNLAPGQHWYPPGYALLGAPFLRLGFLAHPFVVVGLACLVATLFAFVEVARTLGVSRIVAAALFIAAVAWDRQMFNEWVIPWNTTPAAALVWVALALCARWATGDRRPVLLGAVVALVPAFRPTEAPAVAAAMLWVLAADWRAGLLRRAHLVRLIAGALPPLLAAAGLHLAIYGPHPSEYMVISRRLGFTLRDFGWKAYVILADPYWWWTDGPGLLRRIPWAALGLAGLLPALLRGRAAGALACALCVHLVLYVSYLDLLPLGLWRFNNVHYWKWAIPGYALLAWLLVRDLIHWRWAPPSLAAAATLAVAATLSLVRVAPRPATADEPAKMLEYHGDAPGFDPSYFNEFTAHDSRGPLIGIAGLRAFPVPGGMRVIALTRRIEGALVFSPDTGLPPALLASTPARFVPSLTWGRPCWLLPCGKRPPNTLLPPVD